MSEVKRLTPEQIKIAMYLKLLEEIQKKLSNALYEHKIQKKTLADLQAVSQKSCFAIRQMSNKLGDNFLENSELEALKQIENEINYEILIGKVKNKYRWEYTKNLKEYLGQLVTRIANRTGLEREEFYL